LGRTQRPTEGDFVTQPVRDGSPARGQGSGVSLESPQQLDTTLGGVSLTKGHYGPFLLDSTSRRRQVQQQQLQ